MNKIIHRKIKMKPVGVKSGNFVEYNVNSNDMILNLKLAIM